MQRLTSNPCYLRGATGQVNNPCYLRGAINGLSRFLLLIHILANMLTVERMFLFHKSTKPLSGATDHSLARPVRIDARLKISADIMPVRIFAAVTTH
ncbi:hypothetical protein [Undibacterium sp. RuTC16W]|uniref:hypothetical protein n=1 Tax=Undibacterium sp. RuTC16W TaxID=3413048 RepID=UPI003BF098C7